MLTEILVYIALFASLFSGAFTSAFQTIDTINYLRVERDHVDDLYFFDSRLDRLVRSKTDWGSLSKDTIAELVLPDSGLKLDSFSSQILETATSSSRVLLLTLGINKKIYEFYYVQEK